MIKTMRIGLQGRRLTFRSSRSHLLSGKESRVSALASTQNIREADYLRVNAYVLMHRPYIILWKRIEVGGDLRGDEQKH